MEAQTPQEILKLLHGEGPSRITIDSNGQIVSCGRDSSCIIFHKGHLEEETYQFSVDGVNSVLDIACYKLGDQFMVAAATDDRSVLSYSYCSGNINDDLFAESQFNALLVRFTAQINALAISSDDTKLAAGASDFLVKMVDLTDTTKVSTLEGHEAPVLYVQFDPLNKYLASSSCDGTVKIWSIDDKVTVHSIDVFPKVNDILFVSTLCRFSWQPNQGQTLAVPFGKGVKLFGRDHWKCLQTVNEQDEEDKFDHVTCWSPCGKYFAVGSSSGVISIWAWPQSTLISRHNADVGVVSSLCWDPKGDSSTHPLLFSSSSGYVGSFPHQWIYPVQQQDDTPREYTEPDFDDSLLLEGIPADSIFNDYDDDFVTATSNEVTASPTAAAVAPVNNKPAGKRNDDDGSIDGLAPPTKRQHVVSANYFSDDEDVECPDSTQVSSTNEIKGVTVAPPPFVQTEPEYHVIFQPSATPSHLSHRFMVYNMVGVVRCHDDGASSMVEVEFHDSSIHHPFSIPNHYGWTMAVLSSKALILAVESAEDELSHFQCTVFSSWDQNKDWSVQLPKGESIEVIALGDTWVAIATSKNYVRLFSLGGSQREVLSLSGQIVTLAGKKDHLAIVYQETPGSLLTVWTLDIAEIGQVYPPHCLPLTPKSKLEWIGFSEGGLLVSYDTKGIVRVFSDRYGLSWLPVLDCDGLLSQKGDHYFVVGMTHEPNEIRVILCKGLDYPPVHPRPVMSTLPLSVPLCDSQTEKSSVEAQFIEKQFVHFPGVLPSPTDLLRSLMQMMALACHSNHEFRAFEIANMMTLEQGLELAIQYASQSGHFRLARQISNLKERRAIAAAEEETEEDIVCHDINYQQEEDYSKRATERTDRTEYSQPTRKRTGSVKARRLLLPLTREKPDKENHELSQSTAVLQRDDQEEENDDSVNEATPTDDLLNESLDVFATNGQGGLDSQFSSPQASKQRTSNPFKMATPVSKQIQVDRRSSFLDKICHEVSEEKEKEKQKKSKNKMKPSNAVSKVKGKKSSNDSSTNAKLLFTKKT